MGLCHDFRELFDSTNFHLPPNVFNRQCATHASVKISGSRTEALLQNYSQRKNHLIDRDGNVVGFDSSNIIPEVDTHDLGKLCLLALVCLVDSGELSW